MKFAPSNYKPLVSEHSTGMFRLFIFDMAIPHSYFGMKSISFLAVFCALLNLSFGATIPPNCSEYEINRRDNMAGVVVSGTVKKLVADQVHSTNGHQMQKGVVEIKRIFKGEDVIDSLATVKPGRLRPLKSVVIEGFGNPVICENSIRERETKIFYLNPNGNGELKLNSSILPLTLNNLVHVDAVAKDIPYIPPSKETVSPCFLQFCPFGAVCRVNESTNEPLCVCEHQCSPVFAPVCGSDGATYNSLCMLNRGSCVHKRKIRVKSEGACDTNPCSKLVCEAGEECTVDRNGRASCACPPQCEPVLRPVCGNDSTTYDNECELRRKSCQNKIFVTLVHLGACNTESPCSSHQCSYGAVCVPVRGHTSCQCPQCSEEYDPVCGANGITYENECKLRHENCRREEDVKVKKKGACDDCGHSRCEFYAICDNSQGDPKCICPTSCVQVDAPVCGSDGVTYANECELRVQSCQKKIFLGIASKGSCDKCRGVNCKFSARCDNGICVCPILCPTVSEPVCASDQNSYINECEMRKMACAKSLDLEVISAGECESDIIDFSGSGDSSGDFFNIDAEEEMTTKSPKMTETCSDENCIRYGGTCELDGLEFKCSCNFKCQAMRKPVCGSDGRTYGNECMLLHHSCIKKQIITKVSMDNCDEFESEEACDGSSPLINPDTGNDYDCSADKEQCPANSYCHITIEFSKCCKQESAPIRDCSETEFGCCKDGVTPALAPRNGGCPDECNCHPLGSFSTTCDPLTHQCTCKPGVGGKRCDRCEIGYWGMQSIGEHGNAGCIPCNCHKLGSHRDDCEQMTGRCMCHPAMMGMKCDQCRNGNNLGPGGCSKDPYEPKSCEDLNCQFGATCRMEMVPICICEHKCDVITHNSEIVCGSDGQNYGSQCQLEQYTCRMQIDISVQHKGHCKGAPPAIVTTPSPVTKSRKTTRHISDNSNGHSNPNRNDIDNQKENNDDARTKGKPLPEDKEERECQGRNIEELCLTDDECCPDNSYCRGLCYCKDGYIPSLDNKQCYEVKRQPSKNESRDSDVCGSKDLCNPGSTCIPDDYLGYRCACPIRKAGPRCSKDIEFRNPSFSGRSHLELSHIGDASQDLSIDINFSSLNQDGIILFNAKFSNGSGDYVSLSVKGGFVEFRYDLGGGPVILRSSNPIEPKRSHRVNARRSKEMGELIVDSDKVVRGNSPHTHTSLDLNNPMYLGYVPNVPKEIYENIGVDLGLVGCIYSLKAGRTNSMYSYSLASDAPYQDIIKGVDITECGKNPCKSIPCLNGATCLVLDAQIFECRCREGYKGQFCEKLENPCASDPCQYGGTCLVTSSAEGFYCQCPHGREGHRCEKELIPQLFVPHFTGDSYMQMPLEERISHSLSITVWFKSLKPNGVLFFATQSPGGRGDFISLNIKNKKLIFMFFLGSEIGRIESLKHIHLDKWHEVTVTRTGKDGQMSIDSHVPVLGNAGDKGSASILNIDNRPLYVGGFNSSDDLPPQAGIEHGLTGAIQRIIINGRTIDNLMASALALNKISPYNGPPCNVNPCMNDGVCIPMLNRVECRCPADFVGKNCEKRYDHVDKDQPLQFDGLTYLSYPNEATSKKKGQQSNSLKVTFRTTESDGVLLLQRGGDSALDDYLSLAISNGFAQFSYNLGKQDPGNLHIIHSEEKLNDGAWHTVSVERQQRKGILKVDDGKEVVGSSLAGTKQLDTDGLLWVGGHISLPWYLPTTKNFVGCIDKVEVNSVQLHLLNDKYDKRSSIAFCT